MQEHRIKSGSKTIGYIYSFIDTYNKTGDKNLFETILKEVPSFADIGYMGFKTKKAMEQYLAWAMYGSSYGKRTPLFKKSVEMESIQIVETVIKKCEKIIKPKKAVKIFLFPTFDPFVKERMHGSTGFCVFKDTLALYIHPGAETEWKKGLAHSVCHEYAHAVTHDYHEWKTLLDGLVFEGLAEHFRVSALKGKPSKWSTALKEKKAKEILKKLRNKIDSKNGTLYKEVFYSKNKKFPMWTGYSIGYYIIEGHMKPMKKIDWKKVFTSKPKYILDNSNFSKEID
jgi:uncharacterized protein YjaZ